MCYPGEMDFSKLSKLTEDKIKQDGSRPQIKEMTYG